MLNVKSHVGVSVLLILNVMFNSFKVFYCEHMGLCWSNGGSLKKTEEVVHVCHVSVVACQFVILSCVICQAIYELDMLLVMPGTCSSSAWWAWLDGAWWWACSSSAWWGLIACGFTDSWDSCGFPSDTKQFVSSCCVCLCNWIGYRLCCCVDIVWQHWFVCVCLNCVA